MSLVEDELLVRAGGGDGIDLADLIDAADPSPAMRKWLHSPASVIAHHEEACCRVAREWMLATDYSRLSAGDSLTGPRWLRQRFAWGPSRHPIHWCEAVRRDTLDCGALAALAHELFLARGVESYPTQLIQQYSEHATSHWLAGWAEDDTPSHWIETDVVYHEGCAVVTGGDEIKIWDATASWWVNPRQLGGYGGVLALRVFVDAAPAAFLWDTHRITPNEWHRVERAQSSLGSLGGLA